jgi:hypothetical protein
MRELPMSWHKSKSAVVLIIIVLGILFTSSLSFFLANSDSNLVEPEGVPISQTRFAELASEHLDPVMLSGGPIVEMADAVRMDFDESLLAPNFNLNEAEEIAAEFCSRFSYLEGLELIPDPIWNTPYEGKAIASLRFHVGNHSLYAAVNAVSGIVRSMAPGRQLLAPLAKSPDDVQTLSTEQVEDCAFDFFVENNYTLSNQAYYIGPNLVLDESFVGFHVFRIRFICVSNGAQVWGNGVDLSLDIETGEVLHFSYTWVHTPSIPVNSIISASQAVAKAVEYLTNENATGFSVSSSKLRFYAIHKYPVMEYWLCWIVEIEHPYYREIIINAINRDVLDVSVKMIALDNSG